MESRSSILLTICAGAMLAASCAQGGVTNPATASVSANPVPAPKMFERRILDVAGFHNLNEFIRPDVRERLDKEPTGESNEDVGPPAVSFEASDGEPIGETVNVEDETDLDTRNRELEKVKFSWARKKFGDALAADPTLSGVIVLYADEGYYDVYKMLHYIDQGRDRIAQVGGFEASRIQVIFGGYRGKAQVELWIVPEGQLLPQPKPEERDLPSGPEN